MSLNLYFQAKYGKKYATRQEEEQRKAIFEDNFGRINLHNADYEAGSTTYDLSANKYCDLTQDEFAQLHTGVRRDRRSLGGSSSSGEGQNMTNVFMPSADLESEVEDEVDWRKKGAVTPVKNQGKLQKSTRIPNTSPSIISRHADS